MLNTQCYKSQERAHWIISSESDSQVVDRLQFNAPFSRIEFAITVTRNTMQRDTNGSPFDKCNCAKDGVNKALPCTKVEPGATSGMRTAATPLVSSMFSTNWISRICLYSNLKSFAVFPSNRSLREHQDYHRTEFRRWTSGLHSERCQIPDSKWEQIFVPHQFQWTKTIVIVVQHFCQTRSEYCSISNDE